MKKLILGTLASAFLLSNASAEIKSTFTKEDVTKHVSSWSQEAKDATSFMLSKYGTPTGVTADMLVWNNVKPFKRSIVYRETVDHSFPMPHKDVLEHFIDYKVTDAQKVEDLWNFDGSVMLERTKGEMSARCDKEEANILALNLADQIVQGKTSVTDARMEYGRQIMAMKEGSPKELTQKLVFTPVQTSSGDMDQPIMDKLKSETTKQAQEAPLESSEDAQIVE